MKLDRDQVSEAIRSYLRASKPRSRPQERSPFNRYIPPGRDRAEYMEQLSAHLQDRFRADTIHLGPMNDSATVALVVDRAMQTAAPAPRFRVETSHLPSGGLNELEEALSFAVVDGATGATWLKLSGRREASLGTDGRWEEGPRSGVQDVRIDGSLVKILHADGRIEEVELPRLLSPTELAGLEEAFSVFYEVWLRYDQAHSLASWISISADTIAAERQRMWQAYLPVHEQLVALGIASTPGNNLCWERISDGLRWWLSTDTHLAQESDYASQPPNIAPPPPFR